MYLSRFLFSNNVHYDEQTVFMYDPLLNSLQLFKQQRHRYLNSFYHTSHGRYIKTIYKQIISNCAPDELVSTLCLVVLRTLFNGLAIWFDDVLINGICRLPSYTK